MKTHYLTTWGLCLLVLATTTSSISFAARDNADRRDDNKERRDHRDRKEYYERKDSRQERRNYSERKEIRHEQRKDSKRSNISMTYKNDKNYHHDKRYQHDRYYPRRGIHVNVLPSRYHTIRYRKTNYFYAGGIWYRPFGATFTVVAPPFGLVVPVLPPFYSTIWFHSTPYYYANDVCYVWRPALNGYEVTEPPAQILQETPQIAAEELIVYPKQGQSEQKQADDKYECHSWGKSQTQYDPTQPPDNLSVSELNQKRSDYQRAMRACLEGRGYSVR